MGKREYDRAYQRQHTQVVQIRLHKDNDADILQDIIAEARRDGVSVSSRLKRLIRIGYCHYKDDAAASPPRLRGCSEDCEHCEDSARCYWQRLDNLII